MAREWTDEQRAEASRRAKERGFGAKVRTPAAVAVQDVERVSDEQTAVFQAKHSGGLVKTVDQAEGEDGAAITTTHTRPGTLTMYKPTEGQGYTPRTVSASAIKILLGEGWSEHCPECRTDHLGKDGKPSTDPNLCSARPPVAVRVCPVCQKRIYDNVRFSEQAEAVDGDPNVIKDDAYAASSPEQRTKVLLNLHLWVRHARQAQMMNVPALPSALQDMVAEVKPA